MKSKVILEKPFQFNINDVNISLSEEEIRIFNVRPDHLIRLDCETALNSCGILCVDNLKYIAHYKIDEIVAVINKILNTIRVEKKAAFTMFSINHTQSKLNLALMKLAKQRKCSITHWKKNPNSGNRIKAFMFS